MAREAEEAFGGVDVRANNAWVARQGARPLSWRDTDSGSQNT